MWGKRSGKTGTCMGGRPDCRPSPRLHGCMSDSRVGTASRVAAPTAPARSTLHDTNFADALVTKLSSRSDNVLSNKF